MNETFEQDLFCGKVEVNTSMVKGPDGHFVNGWIAVNLSDPKLAQYNGHNVKIKIEVIEDLGEKKPAPAKTKPGRKIISGRGKK